MNIGIKSLKILGLFLLLLAGQLLYAQEIPELAGHWVFNDKKSDSTDKVVGRALKEMGQKVSSGWFSRDKERFRGGPEDQELYDRISYDRVLTIELEGETYLFTYADNYQRPVYTDNRSRSVSLTGLAEVEDFSLGHWENGALLVEARPRDGGFAEETYRLVNGGEQLELQLRIKPRTFTVPIELTRVFDRQP
jgi:hypothetical protein